MISTVIDWIYHDLLKFLVIRRKKSKPADSHRCGDFQRAFDGKK